MKVNLPKVGSDHIYGMGGLRIDSLKPSKPWTLYPNFSQALMIALPELIDTSLSEESPPYMTPILIQSPLPHVINHLQSN